MVCRLRSLKTTAQVTCKEAKFLLMAFTFPVSASLTLLKVSEIAFIFAAQHFAQTTVDRKTLGRNDILPKILFGCDTLPK